MASFLDQSYRSIRNATGISYEVPAVIQFSRLRSILARPVRRIGVVYRAPFAEFIAREKRLVEREQFELASVRLSQDPTDAEVASAVAHLLDEKRADVLWILNDNRLLTPGLIASVWQPVLTRKSQIPVAVGVRTLVDGPNRAGSFAMIPDHRALGGQAADLVFDLSESHWSIGSRELQAPISIRTVADIGRAHRFYGLQANALQLIDDAIE
jgi:hypothetical protein